TYKFEGYKIYQLKNAQVSVQELFDVNKARLIAQVDLRNNVDKLVNFTFDQSLGADVPQLMVDGNNLGISRSFSIIEDQFATGSKTLVNHKTYYFAAVAYAFNDYKTYNPLRAFEGGQKQPYLQGRKNFKIYSAIPHKWEAPRGGTTLNSDYGDGVKITRKDGTGNGGWNLELTQESVDNIMNSSSYFYGDIEYEERMGPIDVKIYDPMKVKTADFIFSMIDTSVLDTLFIRGVKDTTYLTPQAYWKLEINTVPPNGGTVVFADKNISDLNEQLIQDYGISIQVRQVNLPGKAPDDYPMPVQNLAGYIPANGFIEGTMEFKDPEKRWLTGVEDEFTFTPVNWIRSGQYSGGENDELLGFFDDHKYTVSTGDRSTTVFYDPNSVFADVIEGTWAPYSLATNWVNRELTTSSPPKWRTPYSYGPAFPWKYRRTFTPSNIFQITENSLHNLQSVDIYITNDKSKWTHCVVVELGEDSSVTENRAWKGHIRMHHSWNYNGFYETGVNQQLPDTGRSWFPGYAINVETGERLNLMFGEDSWLIGENGRDMKWNPTTNELSPIFVSEPLFGGKHYIYVMNTRYDEGRQIQKDMLKYFNRDSTITSSVRQSYLNDRVYSKIMWVSMAELEEGYKWQYDAQGNPIIPTDVRIRLRVNTPYRRFIADGTNNGLPKYTFSTVGQEALTQQTEVAETACDMIRV
ncbi:MAG TPA: hypothetical protein VNJ07_11290, partial [Chitinophagales bacterium]|nr:hypothetical protein [Chitinophagales bacterium]